MTPARPPSWAETAAARLAMARAVLADDAAPAGTVRVTVRGLADVMTDTAAPPGISRAALRALADAGAWLGLG